MFRLGLAQCRHPEDGNVVSMADAWMGRAKSEGVDLLVFPESLMTPYELDATAFAQAAEPIGGPFGSAMVNLAARHNMWLAFTMNEKGEDGVGAGERDPRPFNTAVVVDPAGQIRSTYRKVHLFDTDFTRESDKVAPGSALPEVVDTPFGRICIAICYDLRFPELARAAAIDGCDVLVYASAWVDGPRKVDQWKTLLRARAIENEIFVAGLSRCDRGFGAAKRDYAGHSCVFSPLGDEIASAGGDGVGEELVIADLDLSLIASARAAMPILSHRRDDLYEQAKRPTQ